MVVNYDNRFYDLGVDWLIEVFVIFGVMEVLVFIFIVLMNFGDEVVLIEFVYDFYCFVIEVMGGWVKLI